MFDASNLCYYVPKLQAEKLEKQWKSFIVCFFARRVFRMNLNKFSANLEENFKGIGTERNVLLVQYLAKLSNQFEGFLSFTGALKNFISACTN